MCGLLATNLKCCEQHHQTCCLLNKTCGSLMTWLGVLWCCFLFIFWAMRAVLYFVSWGNGPDTVIKHCKYLVECCHCRSLVFNTFVILVQLWLTSIHLHFTQNKGHCLLYEEIPASDWYSTCNFLPATFPDLVRTIGAYFVVGRMQRRIQQGRWCTSHTNIKLS